MAQVVFRDTRIELQTQEALNYWRNNAPTYRALPARYQELLNRKIEENIKPLRKIPDRVLKDFPKIPFFEMEEDEALIQIEEWADRGVLKMKIEEIDLFLTTNYPYMTMKSWVADCSYNFKRLERKRAKREAVGPGYKSFY